MNKKEYTNQIVTRLNISFVILLLVTIYEGYYFLNHSYSDLSFVLTTLSGAVTYFSFVLKKFFEDIRDSF